MRLIPLTVEAAIAGLVRTAKRTLDIATPTLDRTVNGSSVVARAKFEVGCLRIILGQLEQLPLDDLWIIPLHRRAQVELVHLVALLGEGVLALDCVAYLLDDSIAEGGDADARDRTEELVDAVWRLQYFRTSMWLLLNVLQSPSGTGVPGSFDSLRTAISCLMDGHSKLARRLRDSDVYTMHLRNSVQLREGIALDSPSHGTNITLADTNSVVSATVPVCKGDLLEPLPYVFESVVSVNQDADAPCSPGSSDSDSSLNSPIPTPTSSPSRSTKDHGRHASMVTMPVSPGDKVQSSTPPVLKANPPVSCALIFHLHQTTPTMILHLFQHALAVSPRFKAHQVPDLFNPPSASRLLRQQIARQKVRPPPYDMAAKYRLYNMTNAQRQLIASASAVEAEEAVEKRLQKQQKLRGLSDYQLRQLCVQVYDELVRRNLVDKKLKALVDSGAGGGYGGYMVGGPNVRQEDVEVAPLAGPSSSSPHGLENALGATGTEGLKHLVGMEDGMFLDLCGDACWELRRRDVEAKAAAGEAVMGGGTVGAGVGKGKGRAGSDTESRLPDDSGTDDSDDYDDSDDSGDLADSDDLDDSDDQNEEEDSDDDDDDEEDDDDDADDDEEEDDDQDDEEEGDYQAKRKYWHQQYDDLSLQFRGAESTDAQPCEKCERVTLQEEDAEVGTEDDVDTFWKKWVGRLRERKRLVGKKEEVLGKMQEAGGFVASDYDDVDTFWKKVGDLLKLRDRLVGDLLKERERLFGEKQEILGKMQEAAALRESFLEKKQEIETVVCKYVSTPEGGHT